MGQAGERQQAGEGDGEQAAVTRGNLHWHGPHGPAAPARPGVVPPQGLGAGSHRIAGQRGAGAEDHAVLPYPLLYCVFALLTSTDSVTNGDINARRCDHLYARRRAPKNGFCPSARAHRARREVLNCVRQTNPDGHSARLGLSLLTAVEGCFSAHDMGVLCLTSANRRRGHFSAAAFAAACRLALL